MTRKTSVVNQAIINKKAALAEVASKPLDELASKCVRLWTDSDALDQCLQTDMKAIPSCHLIYAWTVDGKMLSSLVTTDEIEPSWRQTNLTDRPYLKKHLPYEGLMISSVYKSLYNKRLCVTALHAVRDNETLLGFIAADFFINDLLKNAELAQPENQWQQFRGDPSIRGTVFMQERIDSRVDTDIDDVLASIDLLFREHGIYHCTIHFSSGLTNFWHLDDPYNFRVHGVDDIVNQELCLAYPLHRYSEKAIITPEKITKVFEQFKHLRLSDETIYLRVGLLNIMNGMVGLTFSCDGSHYMPVDEFLDKNLDFWFGSLG